MSLDNYWTRRTIRRRSILRGAGVGVAGAAGFALVGCGDDDDDGNGGQTPAATSPTATQAAAQPTATPAGGAVYGGVGVAQSANVYDSVDPHRSVASPALTVLNRAQSKLLRFTNPNTGELAGDLAEDWEQPDAKTVVLTLRSGVTWQDKGPGAADPAAASGRAFTAEDVIYNIERQKASLLADGTEVSNMGRKNYWKKVDTIDVSGTTVTFHLTQDDAAFVQGLANEFNLFVQRELNEAYESSFSEIAPNKVIGTGPYIITEWVPGERISAVKNPGYFLPDRPYLDAYKYVQTFEDPTAYRIAYEQKQTDSFTDPDPSTVLAIADANKDTMHVRYSGVANTAAIYLPRTQAPWNNDNLIKAIHLAADRRQLIQQLHGGLGKVSGPVSWLQEKWAIPDQDLETTPGYRINKDEDITEARALWEAGGGPGIGDITFVVPDTWASRAGWGSTPELVAEIFNKAFGTSQFKGATKSYSEIIPAWISKNFDPFFGWIPNVEIPDARADLVGAFASTSPSNLWGVNEPDLVDAKLSKALTLTDLEEANSLVREVQDLAIENGQWGRTIMYNYISPAAYWNYQHSVWPSEGEGWNFLANTIAALETWIDPNDPSFAGRQTPEYKAL
jgi:ABC-type transport system substrate-binding protein